MQNQKDNQRRDEDKKTSTQQGGNRNAPQQGQQNNPNQGQQDANRQGQQGQENPNQGQQGGNRNMPQQGQQNSSGQGQQGSEYDANGPSNKDRNDHDRDNAGQDSRYNRPEIEPQTDTNKPEIQDV